ncbi:MAG: hypothetical protein IPO65_07130 [Saprospiraceae bacterium]|nr:hypothetical protein [Saprospiraceae bacterium]MBP9196087.1 hypothetical protein [Saprospiraceae bacterium]
MRVGIFLYLIFVMACKSNVDGATYMNLLNKSGLVQKIETDSFDYTLKLLPTPLMALKGAPVSAANFDQLSKEFAETHHFLLEIQDKYPDRLKRPSTSMYYLTEFQEKLSVNQDSMPSYYHHEASHFKEKETILFGFSRVTSSDILVTIREHLSDGKLNFNFRESEIVKFENMAVYR